jgi:hypothetical protein
VANSVIISSLRAGLRASPSWLVEPRTLVTRFRLGLSHLRAESSPSQALSSPSRASSLELWVHPYSLPLPSPWRVETSSGPRLGEHLLPQWCMAAEPRWSSSKPTRRKQTLSMWSSRCREEATIRMQELWCWERGRENSSVVSVSVGFSKLASRGTSLKTLLLLDFCWTFLLLSLVVVSGTSGFFSMKWNRGMSPFRLKKTKAMDFVLFFVSI